jgi:hypothetical protein
MLRAVAVLALLTGATSQSFTTKSTWRYVDDNTDLTGTGWAGVAFVDSAWKSGAGPFGYGSFTSPTITFGTTLLFGPSASTKYITNYFRKVVTLAAGATYTGTLTYQADDGAVVYLNGVELGRFNMPTTAVKRDTLASAVLAAAASVATQTITLTSAQLLPGDNVLAVEVHQAGPTSVDCLFDAALTVTMVPSATPSPSPSPSPLPPATTLFDFGSAAWTYLDNNVDFTAQAWTTAGCVGVCREGRGLREMLGPSPRRFQNVHNGALMSATHPPTPSPPLTACCGSASTNPQAHPLVLIVRRLAPCPRRFVESSAWKSGSGVFGFGTFTFTFKTTLASGTSTARTPSYYFRKTFTITGAASSTYVRRCVVLCGWCGCVERGR